MGASGLLASHLTSCTLVWRTGVCGHLGLFSQSSPASPLVQSNVHLECGHLRLFSQMFTGRVGISACVQPKFTWSVGIFSCSAKCSPNICCSTLPLDTLAKSDCSRILSTGIIGWLQPTQIHPQICHEAQKVLTLPDGYILSLN